MKTFTWQRLNWFATRFLVRMEQHPVGQLLFTSSWNWDAEYTEQDTTLRFVQPSAWSNEVLVTQDGQPVGGIRFRLFGEQTLQLASGEYFVLSTSPWQQEVYWKTPSGETLLTYQQATWSARSTGIISSPNALSAELERLLLSSGIYMRQLSQMRTALLILILLPLLSTANRH